jgi:DNA-binding IclR family transcriptional regulator
MLGMAGAMAEDEDGDSAERRRGIQSVEIGFRVLAAIAEAGRASSLSAIGQATGLSPSQTHRYLQSLTATGLAIQDSRTGHYDLGPASRRIGIAALGRFDSFERAGQIFPEVVDEIGWTILLAVMSPAGPTLVRWFMGRPAVITNLGLGSVLPLYHSATGRAFIAFSEERELADLLQSKENQMRGDNAVDLAQIRREGRMNLYVRMEGRFIPGLRALSAPIFDMQGRLAFCATAIANAAFPEDDEARVAEALKAACQRVTEDSGGRWPG